jgi:hypothetical protein
MKYLVLLYDGAVSDKDVVNSYELATAPYAFSVGDFVNPFGWGGKNQLPGGEQYEIIAIEHQISLPDSPPQGQHNIAISLKAVKRNTNTLARTRSSSRVKARPKRLR